MLKIQETRFIFDYSMSLILNQVLTDSRYLKIQFFIR